MVKKNLVDLDFFRFYTKLYFIIVQNSQSKNMNNHSVSKRHSNNNSKTSKQSRNAKYNLSSNTDKQLILKNIPVWLIVSIFIVTTVIFFWDQLIGSSFFWDDFVEQVLPIQSFAAQSFANWTIPFWNPYTFCGMPFFADLQVGFFYPLNRLTALFYSNGQLSVWGLQFIIIIHFFIAQFSMYKLMKFFKVSSIGSVISAISYAFSFSLVLHVIHPMMVYHLAWFPLIIMYFLKGLNDRNLKYSIIAGLIFGFSMLAGHAQIILYEALFLGLLFIWYFIASLRKEEIKGNNIMKYISIGILPFIIAVAIFSIQYLPSSEIAKYSKRSTSTYEKATEGSLEVKQIYTAVVPKIFGFIDGAGDKSVPFHLDKAPYYYYWDTGFYFGIGALILGLFGATVIYKKRLGAFLIAISIFGFLFALGDNFILFKIFYNLPFFGLLRIPARIMFYVVIAFSILSGFGFDALWSAKTKNLLRNLILASIIPILITLLTTSGTLLGLLDTPAQLQAAIQGFGTIALVFIIGVIIIAFLTVKGMLKPEPAGVLFIILIFIDFYIAGASFNNSPVNPKEAYRISSEMKKAFVPQIPNNLFRVSMRHYNPSYMAMKRNQGLIDGIMLVEGYNQLVLNYIPPPCDVETIHNLYNVKYAINFNRNTNQFGFIQRQNYFPRAWLVQKAIESNPRQIKALMQNNKFDYENEVVLEKKSPISLSASEDSPIINNSVKGLDYENNYIKYEVSAGNNSILVLSEIWYPAWKAYVDGNRAELLKADYSFRAIPVLKGKHIVEMKYESSKFYLGMWISIITLLMCITGLVFLNKKKDKQ